MTLNKNSRPLSEIAFHCGPQAPPEIGAESRKPSGRRLNPNFAEWLMGLPAGWTAFTPLETEWSRWWRLWRSEYLRLVQELEAPNDRS